jgi:hypothetical protein
MWKKLKIALIILVVILLLPFTALFVLSLSDHRSMHDEVILLVNEELGGDVRVVDISVSYFRRFPNLQLKLTDLQVVEKDQTIIRVGRLEVLFPITSLFKTERKIQSLIIRDAAFDSRIDDLGNRPHFLEKKENQSNGKSSSLKAEIKEIRILNSRLYFSNAIKKNRTGITIEQGRLNLKTTDTVLVITGGFKGALDSLVSNNTVLFANQPVEAKEIRFLMNPKTGFKSLEDGFLLAHTLKLDPRLRMMPRDNGQDMEFHISGDGNFNTFLELFAFHFGINLEQVNPDAKLHISYNQKGFVNPFLRPYSELDFEISRSEFHGPDLPYPIENVGIKGNYNNGPEHSPETVQLVIDTLHAEFENSFLNARLKLSNLKDPEIDAHFLSSLDLGYFPTDSASIGLRGKIDLDLSINGRVHELRAMHLEGKQFARGKIEVNDLEVLLKNNALKIELISGSSLLNNHLLEVTSLVGALNESAFQFEGIFDNLDRFILAEHETLDGRFELVFDYLDLRRAALREMMAEPSEGNKNSLNLEDLTLNLNIRGKEILTDFGLLENFTTSGELTKENVFIHSLGFDYQGGHIEGKGSATLDSSGVSDLIADIKADLKTINLDRFLPGTSETKTRRSAGKGMDWPANSRFSIDLSAGEVIYKDLDVTNLNVRLTGDDQSVRIEKLSSDLPFGTIGARLLLDRYRDPEYLISGRVELNIDSLDVDDFLGLKAFGISMQHPQKKQKGFQNGLPDGLDVQLSLEGNYLSYENVAVSDVNLDIRYMPDSIDLKHLRFDFYGGKVDVHGGMQKSDPDGLPGYLFSNVKDIDIRNFFAAFDNFNQAVFTSENTSGKVSWMTHYYFELGDNMVPVRDKNFWIIQLLVHDAELDKVEPIEETLFFVGHKAKDKMVIKSLNINAFLIQDRLYFNDVLMNDNIANLDLFGEVDLDDKTMDTGVEISLSDLFFRSKKKRMVKTEQGEVDLEKDSKVFLNLTGPLTDNKIKLMNKQKFNKKRKAFVENLLEEEKLFKSDPKE